MLVNEILRYDNEGICEGTCSFWDGNADSGTQGRIFEGALHLPHARDGRVMIVNIWSCTKIYQI